MNLITLWWGCVAVLAYAVVWVLTAWALRPKPVIWQPYPDWFWDGGATVGEWVEVKPEQSDRPESKPESGAG